MDLSTDFMGMHLKNPLILSSGPLSGSGEMMMQALDAGFAAVVTETILNDIRPNVRPRLVKSGEGLQNIWLYTELTLEDWKREIAMVKEADGTLIANILAYSPSEMAFLARKVEGFGADAIELGISSPHGEGIEVIAANYDEMYELVQSVVDSVSIPVIVKLSSNVTNLSLVAQSAQKAGAQGLSAINTVRSILGVNLENQEPLLPTYGGYSGEPIRPIGLAAVATIKQSVELPVSGIGGIVDYTHLLEYIMLGAETCQLHTALLLHGYHIVPKILDSTRRWLEDHSFKNLGDVRGAALPKLKAFDELIYEPRIVRVKHDCPCEDCEQCISTCFYNAITKDKEGKIIVLPEKCNGCGLCISICPEDCFEMVLPIE